MPYALTPVAAGDYFKFDPAKRNAPVFLQGKGASEAHDPRIMLTFEPAHKASLHAFSARSAVHTIAPAPPPSLSRTSLPAHVSTAKLSSLFLVLLLAVSTPM